MRAGRPTVLQLGLDHPAFFQRLEVVLLGPVIGAELLVEVVLAGLERLERDIGVRKILKGDPVEIELAAPDWQIARPVVFTALIGHRPPLSQRPDPIGPRAERRSVNGRLLERVRLMKGAREDRKLRDQSGKVARQGAFGEVDAKGPRIDGGHARHALQRDGQVGHAFVAQRLDRERDIIRRHRRAVRENRLGPQGEHGK